MENPFESLTRQMTEMNSFLHQISNKVDAMSKSNGDVELMNANQSADFLKISLSTIYKYVHSRKIPYHKPVGTKTLYFKKAELVQWVENGRRKTKSELIDQPLNKSSR